MKSKAYILMLVLSIILTIVLPIAALPLNILGMILFKGRARKTYGILTAFSLAILAYIWVPGLRDDLYRHHQQIGYFARSNFEAVTTFIKTNLDPLEYVTKYLIAQMGNKNLLQFFIVLFGYSELFWMVCDYCDIKKVRARLFTLLLLFVLCAVKFIDFASGLWFNFAIINVALGTYLMFFRKTRFSHYIFFAIAGCLHIGTVLIIVLLLLFSKVKIFQKLNLITMTALFVTLLMFGGLVSIVNGVFGSNLTFVTILNKLYDSYFVNGSRFDSLHTGWNLVLPVINIVICLVMSFMIYKKTENTKYVSIVVYLSVCVLAMIINAGVFIRYSFLIVMLGLPILVEAFQSITSNRTKALLVGTMAVMILLQISRSVTQMESAGLLMEANARLTDSALYLINDGGT